MISYLSKSTQRALSLRLLAAAAGAAATSLTAGMGVAAPPQPPPAMVVVEPVVQQSIEVVQTFVGTVMPSRRAVVGAPIDGRVMEYPINEGDRVTKGQTLCQLRTRQRDLELAAARAEANLRREELTELKNGTRPEELAEAKARMQAAKALHEYAASRLERMRQGFAGGGVTQDDVDDALSRSLQAQNVYLAAKATYDLAVAGPRKEKIAQAEARLASQEETCRRLEDEIARHTIVAPFAGYVVAEHTEVGEWVRQGAPVMEVAELDEVDIRVSVVETYVRHVRVGDEVTVRLDSLGDEPLRGTVTLIVPQADVRSRSFPVKIRVKNDGEEGPRLKGGMLAEVDLRIGRSANALLVPKDALVFDGDQASLKIVVQNPRDPRGQVIRVVPVRTGLAKDKLIEVIGDVKSGDRVVTVGNERVFPGEPVQIANQADIGAKN